MRGARAKLLRYQALNRGAHPRATDIKPHGNRSRRKGAYSIVNAAGTTRERYRKLKRAWRAAPWPAPRLKELHEDRP